MINNDYIVLESENLDLSKSGQHIACVFLDKELSSILADIGFRYTVNQWDFCDRLSMRLPPPLHSVTIRATSDPAYGVIGELFRVSQTIPKVRGGNNYIVDTVYEKWWDSDDILGLLTDLFAEVERIHKEHVDKERRAIKDIVRKIEEERKGKSDD